MRLAGKFASSLRRALPLIVAMALPANAQVRISLAAFREPVLLDTMRTPQTLRARADTVYQAVLRAFADLGIPTGRTDNKRGIVGSERFERATSLAGAPMSRSYSCGEGAAGPYADQLRLEIAVIAWVSAEGDHTILSLATIASGRDVSGVFRAPRPCLSTGSLEEKIADRVRKMTGG